MSEAGERHARLRAAANPRRASEADSAPLARLFAAAFANDPVIDWIARHGPKRARALERFFFDTAIACDTVRRGVDGR